MAAKSRTLLPSPPTTDKLLELFNQSLAQTVVWRWIVDAALRRRTAGAHNLKIDGSRRSELRSLPLLMRRPAGSISHRSVRRVDRRTMKTCRMVRLNLK